MHEKQLLGRIIMEKMYRTVEENIPTKERRVETKKKD